MVRNGVIAAGFLLGLGLVDQAIENPSDSPAGGAMRERYVASKRHTIQVDFDDYLHALTKERVAGAARARGKGSAPPPLCRRSAATTAF